MPHQRLSLFSLQSPFICVVVIGVNCVIKKNKAQIENKQFKKKTENILHKVNFQVSERKVQILISLK